MVLLATLAVLLSRRGRLNGVIFLAGFLVGQAGSLLLALLLGSTAAAVLDGSRRSASDGLALALGVALIATAGVLRRSPGDGRGTERVVSLLDRVRGVRPAQAFPAGAAFGVGTKRFLITVVTAATLAGGDLGRVEMASLSVLYVLTASVVVWLPVGLYLLAGPRSDAIVERAEAWLLDHWQAIGVWLSAGFGVLICADALLRLLG